MQSNQDRPNRSASLRPLDTSEDAARVQIRVLRRLGLQGRARMTFELCENLRRLVRDGLRDRHPDWTDQSIKREVFRIFYGNELAEQVFGDSTAR